MLVDTMTSIEDDKAILEGGHEWAHVLPQRRRGESRLQWLLQWPERFDFRERRWQKHQAWLFLEPGFDGQ